MAMGLVDRALRAQELNEEISAPAQMAEFVLYHSDNVEASGFVQHLKLPHYVDFQSELNLIRSLRRAASQAHARCGHSPPPMPTPMTAVGPRKPHDDNHVLTPLNRENQKPAITSPIWMSKPSG